MSLFLSSLNSIAERISNKFYSLVRLRLTLWKVNVNWVFRHKGKAHNLPAPLILALTSYPPRFPTLPLTLKCLLSQTVSPDRVILWIAFEDKNALTAEILDFRKDGLEIRFCEDLGSFKKIIPTLEQYPEAFIVTADDDLYYPSTWLEELAIADHGNKLEIVCHRAHKIRLDKNGLPFPYLKWEHETKQTEPSPLIFPTGGAGILYPPGAFHSDVLRSDIFSELCPSADDVWLYWMMRLNGAKVHKVGPCRPLVCWAKTQETGLWEDNKGARDGNNAKIQGMIKKYGFPR